ncbi:glycosyltransferase family 25 protein [Pasteurella canis]|uniref:glycosyltransferase family 25 protein n=1 Tax=Pasteurella canis TaxID=753 RepID=UPI001E62CCAC|nr:glycosyltransferase family 25 protein [Pasteurella canis]UEA17197.1 glycosyltransferase family 25 protein [Pasteurella canis]
MMNINYVISIATATERRGHIEKEFSSQHIPFEFFDALTPSTQLTETINRLLPELLSHPNQTLGEKACFMSHILLWEKCINDNMPFITIFEDDVILSQHSRMLLTNYDWINEFSGQAFIIKLETFLKPVNTKVSHIKPYSSYNFPILDSEHVGAAGYIISQQAAKLLLTAFLKLSNEQFRPIDILIFDTFLKFPQIVVYQLEPALCMQLPQQDNKKEKQIKSQLSDERKKNEQLNPYKTKHSLGQLLIKGLTKPYRLYKKKQRKIIPFE